MPVHLFTSIRGVETIKTVDYHTYSWWLHTSECVSVVLLWCGLG